MSENTADRVGTAAKARSRRTPLGLKVVLVAATAVLIGAGLLLRATAPVPVSVAVASDVGIDVETLAITRVALQPRVEKAGIIAARRQVKLVAEQGGRVLEIHAEELDRVEGESVLLRLDPLAAEVEVARSEASLARAQSELDLARNNLKRRQDLASSDVSSESDLDRTQNDERVAVATLRAAEAGLRDARDRLNKKTILAPFSGLLREFSVATGEVVQPGQRIGELLEVSRVRVTIGLRDREVVIVSPGARARIRVEALPDQGFEGVVLRVAGAADPRTRKFPVQIEIDNPDGRLLPGMVARVAIDLGEQRHATLVPREAVLDEFGLSFVYVVGAGPDGQPVAQKRRIAARDVPFQPGKLQVSAGLAPGERIAITRLRQLTDGARVAPRGPVNERLADRP